MKPEIRITLFGRFSVRCGDQLLLDHTPHRAQELLAYLVLHQGRAHPREALAGLLWPAGDGLNSRKCLRQALWQLHAGLVALGRSRAARLLHAETEWVELELDDRVQIDVVLFDRALAATRRVWAESLRPEDARGLAEAVQLYRGDLLEGWYAEWCQYERDRFRRMYLTLLDTLADYWEARQEYEAAIAYATAALRQDPARERTHRSLMRLLAKSGDRTGALRQYERCVATLQEELTVEPEPETVVLQQLIRTGGIVGAIREPRPTGGVSLEVAHPSRPFAVVTAEGSAGSGRRPARPN
jgi:DNA-binding SARP family transcriptional activator